MGTYLITGATSGIGLALAQRAHRQGHRLILVGRRPLEELSASVIDAANYCESDLSSPNAPDVIEAWCDQLGVAAIDVLINNAGVGFAGPLWDQSASSIRELVALNVQAPIALTQRLLPRLRAASGTAVFVSSVMSRVATPDMAVYAATKKALDGFVRSVRAERSIGNVTLRSVYPGATRTAMPDKVGIPASTSDTWRSAESVADEILAAVTSRSPNQAIGLDNKTLRTVAGRVPGIVSRVASRGHDRPALPAASPTAPPRVLITGAADGIGRALALHYARNGADVVGVDVDSARADETIALGPTGRIEFCIDDLRSSDMEWVAAHDPFDVVVHNAGISAVGSFESIEPERHRSVIDLNFTAPMVLTQALLSHDALARDSRIIFVSSLSHQMGYPGAAVYAASKDGLELYGRAVRAALGPDVATTTVFPGPVRTAHAARYSPRNDAASVARRMDPDALAQRIAASTSARLFPGWMARASATLGTVSPAVGEAVMRKSVYAGLAAPTDDVTDT